MRIIAAFLFFVFFGFNAVLSATVLWQDDDTITIVALQEEEEDDETGEKLKELFLPIRFNLLCNCNSVQTNQTYTVSVDQIVCEVSQNVLYSPPEIVNG